MTNFRINVIVDPKGAVAGAKVVESQLRKTKGTADSLRASMLRTFGGLGLAVGIAGSVRLLADFSQAMSTVKAVTGATEEQFAALNARAQELGRTTRFTATQAAEGMVLLARAGFTAEESLAAVGDTLKLAQAGELGLAEAASIAAASLRGFRLDVSELSQVTDVLTLAANSANTNVQQLGEGLKFVAPVAAGLNVSIEQTVAAIGKLSDSGLQASLAGTGLRRVLAELEAPSSKTAGILRDLGVNTDDVRVSQVGLVEALTKLKEAGVDTGQALTIFGQRGGPAFEVLSNNIPAIAEMSEKLEGAAGTADRVAEVMDDNLNGALLRTLSALQGFIIAAGDSGGFIALTGFANGLSVAFNFLTDNIEATGVALSALGVGLLLTKTALVANVASAAAATGAYIAQTTAATILTFQLGGLTAVAAGAATALKAAATAAIAGPFALVAAGATAAFFAIKELNEGIDEYLEATETAAGREFSGLTEFAKVGEKIRQTQQRVEQYKKLIDGDINRGLEPNAVQVQMLERTEEKLAGLVAEQERLKNNTPAAIKARQELQQAEEALFLAFDRSTINLEKQNDILLLNNQEREVQSALLKEIQAIQKEGGPALTPEQVAELEGLVRRNQLLQDQADALDGIRGPQEDFERQLAALQALLDTERITLDEFNTAVGELASSAEGIDLTNIKLPEGAGDLDLQGQMEAIRALVEEEQRRQEIEAQRAQVLRDLADPADQLIARQEVLNTLLKDGSITQQQYNEEQMRLAEELRRLNPEYALQAQILEEIRGPQEEQAARIAALGELLQQEKITLEEYNAEMARLGMMDVELGTSFGDGISSGLKKVGEQMQDIASVSEAALVNAFGAAEDALVEFATTGKFSFKEFASAILSDIARIIARQLILNAIMGLGFGDAFGIGAAGAGAGATGAASGGDFESNQSMIVGEKGPEMVTFGAPGTVMPAEQTAQALAGMGGGEPTVVQAPAPNVNLNVVNVDSPDAARDAMDSDEGGQVIMNQIRKNRAVIQRELQ